MFKSRITDVGADDFTAQKYNDMAPKSDIASTMQQFIAGTNVPVTTQPTCTCDHFLSLQFFGMDVTYRCPVHGEITLRRQINFTQPIWGSPYTPVSPTWSNGTWTKDEL